MSSTVLQSSGANRRLLSLCIGASGLHPPENNKWILIGCLTPFTLIWNVVCLDHELPTVFWPTCFLVLYSYFTGLIEQNTNITL